MEYKKEKFINAVLFFGENTDSSKLGVTKLLKLLFLADFKHFKKYGRSITGDKYSHCDQGPVPSTSYDIFKETEEGRETDLSKVIKIIREKMIDYSMSRIETMSEPNLDVFSKSDIEVMKEISEKFKEKTATEIINQTIEEIDFVNETPKDEYIDYKSALTNEEDKAYIEKVEKERKILEEIS